MSCVGTPNCLVIVGLSWNTEAKRDMGDVKFWVRIAVETTMLVRRTGNFDLSLPS